MTERENYDKSYIAVPLRESPLLDWAKSLNNQKQFFHMTFYFLGEINEDELARIKDVIQKRPETPNGFVLIPDELDMMGVHEKTHVLRLKESEELFEFRIFLEEQLSQYKDQNLPFVPHITIRSYGRARVPQKIATGSPTVNVPPYKATSIGVYYKTDEGATALLYSKKI